MDHNFQHITINHCKMIEYIYIYRYATTAIWTSQMYTKEMKFVDGVWQTKKIISEWPFSSYSIQHCTGYHKFVLFFVCSVGAVGNDSHGGGKSNHFRLWISHQKNTYCEQVSDLRYEWERDRERKEKSENDRIFRQEMPIDILYSMLSLKCVDWYFAEHIAYWWFHVITWLDIAELKIEKQPERASERERRKEKISKQNERVNTEK